MSVMPYDNAIGSAADFLKELILVFKPSERKRRVKAIRAANKALDMVIENRGSLESKTYKEFKKLKEEFDDNLA